MDNRMTVVVDTREQRPYRFPGALKKALPAGDYSLVGLEEKVAVERKTLPDAYGSLGRGRQRFEREVVKLSAYDHAALVVEASLEDFLQGPAFGRMSPRGAVNSLISWSVKYGIHVHFAGSRALARSLTYRILEKCWKHRRKT